MIMIKIKATEDRHNAYFLKSNIIMYAILMLNSQHKEVNQSHKFLPFALLPRPPQQPSS